MSANYVKKYAKKVWAHNTYRDNEIYVVQEMAELTQAVSKNQLDKCDWPNTTVELAHVLLMATTLQLVYGITDKELKDEMQKVVTKNVCCQ